MMKQAYSLEIMREVNDDGSKVKEGKTFLPQNFKFNGKGKSDLVILLSNSSCYCPVVTGEAKKEFVNLHDHFYQLLVNQLALQRTSMCVGEEFVNASGIPN